MSLARSDYDRGVNTFSPEGRLFQVEYATEAIKLGSIVLGIQTREGVVLAAEKRITSSLLIPASVEKVVQVDSHLGMALSGVSADARSIIDHARLEAANHTFMYEEKMPVESVARSVSDLALRFGEGIEGQETIMSRPFGVALLLGGVDCRGPQLFHSDPSGTFLQHAAKAIGAGAEAAQLQLQTSYRKEMSLDEAICLSLQILKQIMEEKMTLSNVDVATVTSEKGFVCLTEDTLKGYYSAL